MVKLVICNEPYHSLDRRGNRQKRPRYKDRIANRTPIYLAVSVSGFFVFDSRDGQTQPQEEKMPTPG